MVSHMLYSPGSQWTVHDEELQNVQMLPSLRGRWAVCLTGVASAHMLTCMQPGQTRTTSPSRCSIDHCILHFLLSMLTQVTIWTSCHLLGLTIALRSLKKLPITAEIHVSAWAMLATISHRQLPCRVVMLRPSMLHHVHPANLWILVTCN